MHRAILSLLVFAAGCVLEDMRMRGVPEGSPSWRFGYGDGCHSGRRDARSQRHDKAEVDRERFRADDEYRTGWEAGYDDCFARVAHEGSEPTPPAPQVAVAPVAPAAPAELAAPAAVAVAAQTPAPAAPRRVQIERRIRQLRGELEALEKELADLP